jgi:hypothetical protein
MKHDLVLFLGRFHSLLIHLPIGGLAVLAFLELMAALTRRKHLEHTRQWIVDFVALSAVAAAGAGWLLVQDGDYNSPLLTWHRALGLALIGVCLLTGCLHRWGGPWSYRVSLVISLGLLVPVGHLGGSITHGRDFFTRYAPKSVCARLGLTASHASKNDKNLQPPVFEAVIAPILEERCYACHGPERHNAQLRLDTIDGWLRGSQDSRMIKPGDAKKSLLIQRLRLPLDADGHMPPEDQPQPTIEEIALLEWWVNIGAPTTARVKDLDPEPEIRRLLQIASARPVQRPSDGQPLSQR